MIKVVVTPRRIGGRYHVSLARAVGNNKAIHECLILGDGNREFRVFGKPKTAIVTELPDSRHNQAFMRLIGSVSTECAWFATIDFSHPLFSTRFAGFTHWIRSQTAGYEVEIDIRHPSTEPCIRVTYGGLIWAANRDNIMVREATSRDALENWLAETGLADECQPYRDPRVNAQRTRLMSDLHHYFVTESRSSRRGT